MCGIASESFMKLQNDYIIDEFKGALSLLFMVTTILSVFQFLLNKIKDKHSLWIPVILDLFMLPIIFILFFNEEFFLMICVILLTEGFISVLFLNRKNLIIHKISKITNIKKFMNSSASFFAIGQILGYIVSMLMLKYFEFSYKIVYFVSMIVWLPCVCILFYENYLILKKEKLKNEEI
jgi:MFS family permease